MRRFNILMTAGSRRVPLVHAFRNALRATGTFGSVIVTDVNPLSPAVHVADKSYRVPLASGTRYDLSATCTAGESGFTSVTMTDPNVPVARRAFRNACTSGTRREPAVIRILNRLTPASAEGPATPSQGPQVETARRR